MNRFQLLEMRAAASRGVAALEFALLAPFVILVMLAGADLSLFMRTVMRMDETATGLAMAVTQYDKLYNGDFANLFNASQTIAGTTTPVTGLLGTTIITGIVKGGGKQTIAWQQRSTLATFNSLFGTAVGAAPVLPDGYVLPTDGEVLIAVEVFTTASPWVLSATLMGGPGSTSIRSFALFQPRLGSLAVINPGNRP
jgi:Flp pilus assembly protein TadG